MRIPEKLKNGDPFKRTTVDAVNEIIDFLRAQAQQQPSAPRGGYRQFTETDFMVTKIRLANKNDALAVNGGTLHIDGGFLDQSDFVFDPVMLDISSLGDGAYSVIAAVFYAGIFGWKKRVIFCNATVAGKLFCNSRGFDTTFFSHLGVVVKSHEDGEDPETGDPITYHRITSISAPVRDPSYHPGADPSSPILRLNLAALSSSMPDGYLLTMDDFATATIHLRGFIVVRYESSGSFTTMTVSGSNTIPYSAAIYNGIALVNSGTFSAPNLSVQIYETSQPASSIKIFTLRGLTNDIISGGLAFVGAFPLVPPILVYAKGNFT